MYLFGYGSLINIQSAQKSFKRELKQENLIPICIKGYEKVWNSIESIKFDEENVKGIFLNLKENSNSSTCGVVIKITEEEFELLKLREKNYSQIIIKASNADIPLNSDIVAFMTTNDEKLAKKGDENCFIPAKYIEILTSSFPSYSTEFVNKYKECLKDYPFSLKEGTYTFCDPIQNKFAKKGLINSETK